MNECYASQSIHPFEQDHSIDSHDSYNTDGSNSSSLGYGYISNYDDSQYVYSDNSDMQPTESTVADIFSLARHNKVHHVNALLDQGLSVNISDSYGNTILIVAAQNGLKKLAKSVLRRGANINKANFQGNTPLHFCFQYGYGESLGAYLISKGADTNIKNFKGFYCYDGLTGEISDP